MLRTDYKDDIIAESMGGRRRYQMISNSDGTVSFIDMTQYEQVGDTYGASEINASNTKLNAISDVLDTGEEIMANTEGGKVAGALGTKELISDINSSLSNKLDKSSFQTVIQPLSDITGMTLRPYTNGIPIFTFEKGVYIVFISISSTSNKGYLITTGSTDDTIINDIGIIDSASFLFEATEQTTLYIGVNGSSSSCGVVSRCRANAVKII